MLFLQTVLNYQGFMYPNISPCPSLLPLKTAATFASLNLSLLTRRGSRSKDPDRRGVVWTEFANVLKLDFTAHSRVHNKSILLCSCIQPCFPVDCLNPVFMSCLFRHLTSQRHKLCLALVSSQNNPGKTM